MKIKDDITELKKELNLIENTDIAFLTNSEDAIKALLDEAKETPKEPNLRRYMDDLKPEYNKDGQIAEKSYNEHLNKRTEFYNKVIDGYKFEDKYLYYNITNLKSIKTIKRINKMVETIKRLRNNKDFKPESLFNDILSDLTSLPEPIAASKIEAFKTSERAYIDIMDITKEREDTNKLDEDAILMINLTNYLETNYKPQQPIPGTNEESKRDLSKLDDLIHPNYKDKQRRDDISLLDRVKSDINTFVSSYNKSQITALALLIYESDLLHKNTKPEYFVGWKSIFCDIIGVPTNTLKPSAVKKDYEALKKTYYYILFP